LKEGYGIKSCVIGNNLRNKLGVSLITYLEHIENMIPKLNKNKKILASFHTPPPSPQEEKNK
jgi:hypothetical protein